MKDEIAIRFAIMDEKDEAKAEEIRYKCEKREFITVFGDDYLCVEISFEFDSFTGSFFEARLERRRYQSERTIPRL